MRIKVHPSTAGESLCTTCSHSTIIRGRSSRDEIVECNAPVTHGRTIPFAVSGCSAYIDSRLPSYHELVHAAWILMPRSKRRMAGFVRGSELTPEDFRDVMHDAPDDPE